MTCRRAYRWERALLERVWKQAGQPAVQLALWDGFEVGAPPAASVGRIVYDTPRALRRMTWDASLAFGEGFTTDAIRIEGDLTTVLTVIMQATAKAEGSHTPGQPLRDWFVRRRGHSLQESKSSVYHHYDLGNDFYRLWLDEQMAYTCAYFEQPDLTLEAAQIAKFDHVCRKLRLLPGETVAEAGCGWGGLALHMARHYGVRVRACNLSKEQLAWARERARREGLADRVEFIEEDYRNLSGTYDAFVSVGMLEHVGVEQYPAMGKTLERILSPQGRGLIHTIGRNAPRRLDAWTEKYIFPGAEPPSLSQMLEIFEPHGCSVLDVENLRLHYGRTLEHWLERFDAHRAEICQQFDERFVRMWRFYLAASIAAFRSGYLQLFQVVFTRAANNSVPWTRADLYQHAPVTHTPERNGDAPARAVAVVHTADLHRNGH